MKNLSGQESLWVALPLLVVIILLIIGAVFLPSLQAEIRSRASEPRPAIITPSPKPLVPEVVCSQLYEPVCAPNGQTYSNSCEANLAGVTSYLNGECSRSRPTTPLVLPTSN